MSASLKGTSVIVTGGSKGIARVLAGHGVLRQRMVAGAAKTKGASG